MHSDHAALVDSEALANTINLDAGSSECGYEVLLYPPEQVEEYVYLKPSENEIPL